MADNVGGIEYTIEAKVDQLLAANKRVDTSLANIESKFNKTGAASSKLNSKLSVLSTGIKKAGSQMVRGTKYSAALAVSLGAITKVAASAGAEISRMATLSNVGVERFQELSYGASQLGISTEKLGDIFKDTQDKVGDFIATGGGELADYFENIAPLVGQTAEEFATLSGPDALIKFKEGLDAANISAGQQVFYLESLANDAAILSPLLADNAKGFNDAADEARKLNLVLSAAEVKELESVNKEFNALLTTISKMTQKIVAENGPQIRAAIQEIITVVTTAGNSLRGFFTELGGGSELSKIELEIEKVTKRIEYLGDLTKGQYAVKVEPSNASAMADVIRDIERYSEELDRLQADERINVDIKSGIESNLIERISLLNGELFELKEEISQGYDTYVSIETQKAQEDLMLLNGELETLKQESEGGTVIEINAGATKELSIREQLMEALNISGEVADSLIELDNRMANIGTTISDSLVNSALTFGDTIGDAFANGIAEGESFKSIMSDIATTISTQVLSSLISLGVQYGINAALQGAADATMAASSVAATTASTAAGVAAASTLASAYAPAAAAASVATSGGAAVAGTTGLVTAYSTSNALALSGGRMNGGQVTAGNAYEVTENGKPEMLTVGGKDILMMGNQSGTVTSNSDLSSGSTGGNVYINVVNSSSSSTASATSSTKDGKTIVDIVVADISSNGKIAQSITNNTTANYKAR